jgi:hypothetical protein
MRPIDADRLKNIITHACESNGDDLSLQWLEWFDTVINMQPTIGENEIGSAKYAAAQSEESLI